MNNIIVYIPINEENKITVLYLRADWVEKLSSGFGMSKFGLYDFGF